MPPTRSPVQAWLLHTLQELPRRSLVYVGSGWCDDCVLLLLMMMMMLLLLLLLMMMMMVVVVVVVIGGVLFYRLVRLRF